MNTLKTVTLTDIRSWDPCYDPIKWVPEGWRGNALDVLRMKKVPADDRLWCVLRKDMIDDRSLRLFACDCAERVLPLFEAKYPDDKRPRTAIEVSRRYVNGDATEVELESAGAAAGAAARAAAWDAAGAAAGAAAKAAAKAAAGAAALKAEVEWQVGHLIKMLEEL